ncbi:hypothetical protein H0H92_006171 [Tricholoma furcatifolium]|nr:hypothetical protein H0H92_006171 [Tricholoma furcatifolium]
MTSNPSLPIQIPETARAAVLSAHGEKYVIKNDYPVPQPASLRPGECLVKIEYTGVCHSDLHIQKGDWARKSILPLIGGHEAVGRVVAIGEHSDMGVGTVKVGDRVGVKWIANVCLMCENCRKGNDSCCPVSFAKAHGFTCHGTFAEYVLSYVNYVTPIPTNVDSAAATPILCAGLTAYRAVKDCNAKIGDWVAIPGAGGGLGHLGTPTSHVPPPNTGEAKKELCMKLGAEKWVDFKESTDLIKDVQAAADGFGPHAAVIVVGDARPFNQALMYLRMAGTLVAVGMPGGNAQLNVPVTLIIGKKLTILGSALGNRQDVTEALDIVASGKVKCQYQIRELGEVNEVLEEMESGKIVGRVLLKI